MEVLRPESYNCKGREEFLPGVSQTCGAPLCAILVREVDFISRRLMLGFIQGR